MFVKAKNSGPLVRVKGEGSETVDSFGTDEAIHRLVERYSPMLLRLACTRLARGRERLRQLLKEED